MSMNPAPSSTFDKLSWLAYQVTFWGGCLITAACALLWYFQDHLLYYPTVPGVPKRPEENPYGFRNPKDHGLEYEDMYIQTLDGILIHGWLLKYYTEPHTYPTIIFFHGNAGNIGFRLTNAVQMLHLLRCNVLLVEYRGYGNSDGVPSEQGLMLDAEAALGYLYEHQGIDPSRGIFAFGRSLGGAVAVGLAEKYPDKVHGLIVENTFLSISAMVDAIMPSFIRIFKPLVLRIDWSNQRRIPNVVQPILFLAGGKDELVPPEHMLKLFDLALKSAFKERYVVESGTHNDTWHKGGPAYYEAIKKFLARVSQETLHITSNCSISPADNVGRKDQQEQCNIPQFSECSNDVAGEDKQDQSKMQDQGDRSETSIPIMPTLFGKEKKN